MTKISVIIPVYNVEKYLKRCLDSVVNQTLKDIEIICINDCSPDNSIDILREYELKDKRIRVIDFSENKGVSIARNVGIKEARGEYIGFVDSDDYIDLDFYEKLYKKALESKAEIVKGADCELVYEDGSVFNTKQNEKIRENKVAFCYQFYTAVYKHSFIEKYNLKFPEDCGNFEDPVFAFIAACRANKVEIEDTAVYHYMRRNDCQSNKAWTKAQLLTYIKYVNYLIDFALKQNFSKSEYNAFFSFIINSIHNVKKYRAQNDKELSGVLTKMYIENVIKKEKGQPKQKSLISVIIPVKNGENYIKEAIEGIKAQNMNTEIIVVDDGSDDKTSQIADNLGCIVIKHDSSHGPVVAKNTGLKASKGSFILFHDHDDIMNDGVLSKMYSELIEDTENYAVMAKVKDFKSYEIKDDDKAAVKEEPYWGLLTGAVLFKKEIFDIIGLFDEKLTAGEIISLQTKMNEKNIKMKKLDLVSTNRRIHNTNFGRTNQKKEYQDYASILRAKLGRK